MEDYNAHECEKKWQDYWEKQGVYKFSSKHKGKIFSIDTPPPTVSGMMHVGHAFSYSHQDFIARYHRMKGENVFYPWGFDDNGLATERFVEKKKGIRGVDMSRSDFIKLCLKETVEAEKELKDSWKSIGMSVDWTIFYRTIDDWCRRVSQLSFLELYEKGREYRKEAVTIFCPACRTAIAQVELKDRDIDSTFNDLIFKVDGKDLTISTTRPELLGSCVAVFYNPDDKRYKKLKGKKATVPLFNFEVPILEDKRVDMEKGTGIAMCCTFGDLTDIEWWQAYKLPLKISISQYGTLNEIAGSYNGMKIKDARYKIIDDLKEKGLLVSQQRITHAVNVHERCGTEVEFTVSKQWFIRYLDLKEEFIELGRKIKWYPQHMRNRYENWIRGLQWDWCISRQRFFGVPFPVWYCKKCENIVLADEKDLPVDPIEDKPPIKKCLKCGSDEFIPEKDVLDTWATSSLTPQIALKWHKDSKFFKSMFPMDLRPQAHDIISFWAFNTVVKSYLHENSIPWKNIMISGYVLSEAGEGMSKSKGNIVEPKEMLKKYSADAMRFWAAGSSLGEDLRFMEKDILTGQKMIAKLWNASKFCIMHLNDYKNNEVELEIMDKWLLSKLQHLIKSCTEFFDNYEYAKARTEIEKFFWHTFCDYYLEVVKRRVYGNKKEEGESARFTLYNSLLAILKLIAPIMPHVTEEIYNLFFKNFEKEESIHITKWPEFDKRLVDKNAEETGDNFIELLSKINQFKAANKKSLKSQVALTIEKAKLHKLKDVLEDFTAVTSCIGIKEGDFNIDFLDLA